MAIHSITPFTGEPVALDLVNTRPLSSRGPVDLIGSVDGLRAWLALERGRLVGFDPADAARLDTRDLERIWNLRDRVASLVDSLRHGRPPPTEDLDVINAMLRDAPVVPALVLEGRTLGTVALRSGPPGLRLAACLAEAAVDLVTDPASRGIRKCAAPNCTMLFLPTHPRRRWCSAMRCGNRERVARHYRRRSMALRTT